jgi:hypothetical protein
MRRYFESLRPADRSAIDSVPDGLFLVRVERVQYRWHVQKPYYQIRFAVLEPKHLAGCLITGRLYSTAGAMWKLIWFLCDFGYDTELLGKDEIDDQALVGLQGVLKVSHAIVHGICLLNLDGFAPLSRWKELSPTAVNDPPGSGGLMIYSYTQISQYLTCPRRYRHHYLDGWQEKDTRAAMLFGRAFEHALAAYFLRQDAAAALFEEWKLYQSQKLEYSHGDTWDRMLEQGIQLLDRFCQEDRVRIRQPRRNLQIKFVRPLSGQNEFVAYIDAIGRLDDRGCLLE